MLAGWASAPFDDVFSDETGGNAKTLQSEFAASGRYPIVDQGKALIAGFTNDPTRLCKSVSPVIVFGDHTRAVKFIDFPFCLGADGTKILKPRVGANPKFLFHYLRSLDLPDAGYSRHFKYLKRVTVPLPPAGEQRCIAAILDQADALRAKRRAVLAQLDEMAQAIFVEMFGDPRVNPKGFPIGTLNELGCLDRGVSKHRPRNAPELLGGTYPLVQTGDVSNSQGYIRSYKSSYSEIGLKQSKMWPAGTLCITIAANIARVGILAFDACFPDSVVGYQPHDPGTVEYIRVWFGFVQRQLEESAPESTQKNINLAILRSFPLPIPPLEAMKMFASRVQQINVVVRPAQQASDKSDALFTSLQHRAFRGEL